MDWKQIIRTILELIGVIESRQKVVSRRLAAANQNQPRGTVSVVLEDMGPRQTSAVVALRKLTGLNITDTLTIVNEMLPLAILRHVSPETAVMAQDLLESVGATVKIIGDVNHVKPETPPPPDDPDIIELPPPELNAGNGEFVVILNNAGLLPDRIAQILQGLTGWKFGEVMTAVTQPPQPIMIGVDETTAIKAQQELQMFGAVVDVLRWEDYDEIESTMEG